MALDLGYDEGGSGDELLVSVQVGFGEQAKKLKRKWKQRLLVDGLPYFHSVDLWNMSKGVFSKAGMDRAARIELLRDLSNLIHKHMWTGVTARISQKLYRDNTTAVFRSQHGTAYGCAINSLLLAVYILAKQKNVRPEVNIKIERGHKNAGQSLLLLDQWKHAPPVSYLEGLKILDVGLGAKEDHPILQSADMLAYCKHQHLIQGDRAIYEALHRKGSPYHPWALTLDITHIEAIQKGPLQWVQDRMEAARKRHKENEENGRVSEFRQNDAEANECSTLGDQSSAGRGESSKAG